MLGRILLFSDVVCIFRLGFIVIIKKFVMEFLRSLFLLLDMRMILVVFIGLVFFKGLWVFVYRENLVRGSLCFEFSIVM